VNLSKLIWDLVLLTEKWQIMVDLLDEVRADLKEEQTVSLLKKYGTFTVVIMGLVLFAMTGNLWWKSYQESRIHKEGGEFLISALKMRANKIDDAMNELKVLAHDGQTSYAVLANLNLASYQQAKKEYDKAAESYKSVMNHPKTPAVLAEYSELMYLKAKLSDSASNKQELLKHLTTFVQTKPTFKSSALEILAALQIELNLMQEAKESLDKLSTDTNIPPTMKTRVEQLRNYVS
jgi:hypothetical protein